MSPRQTGGQSPARVVVTGLGATTPVGGDVSSTWEALLAGRSGVGVLTDEWVSMIPVQIGARVAVEPVDVLGRVQARRLDRSGQFALVAAREAWADAGLATGEHGTEGTESKAEPPLPAERLGVVVASGIGGVTTLLDNYDQLKEKGARRVSPLAIPMLMPNGPAAAVGLEVGAQAGVHTPVSACSSGAEAIGYAMDMIRSGRADVVVAGGTEAAIHPLPMAAFGQMMALSRRNDEPERASRPYDKGRDGFVLGEGAGIVVLESAEHAEQRGARVYAEVVSSGITADSHHIAQPEPEGLGAARAIRLALENGGLQPAEVAHLNAHATSTPLGDVAEVRSIRAALGEDAAKDVAITSTKSMTGHLLGAAGAVEAIATILSLHERKVPPTINVEDMDDDVELDVVVGEPRALADGPLVALNNSFGFGGHNVTLAFRRTS